MKFHRDVTASSFGDDESYDSPDPMSGMGNLADCMLVVVCGLMIAFLVRYNVFDTPVYNKVEPTGQKVMLEQDPSAAGVANEDGDQGTYKKLGTLYQDDSTGEMYYIDDSGNNSNTKKKSK